MDSWDWLWISDPTDFNRYLPLFQVLYSAVLSWCFFVFHPYAALLYAVKSLLLQQCTVCVLKTEQAQPWNRCHCSKHCSNREQKKGSRPEEFFVWISRFRHSWCFTPVCYSFSCMKHWRAEVRVFWEEMEKGRWYILSRYRCSLASDSMCWQAQGRPAFLGWLRSWVKSSLDCSLQELNPKTFAFWPRCRLQLGLGDTYPSAWEYTCTSCVEGDWVYGSKSILDWCSTQSQNVWYWNKTMDDAKIDCLTQT